MAEKIFDEFKRNLTKGLPVALATIIEGPGQALNYFSSLTVRI